MVRHIFGANNVAKVLQRLPSQFRNEAVDSYIYEAKFRLLDPVHGCIGYIRELEQQLRHVPRQELSGYTLPHPHNSGGGGGGGEVGGGNPFGIPTTLVASSQTQMLLPQNQQEALLNQHIAATISNYGQQEIWNSMFSMGGDEAGRSVMSAARRSAAAAEASFVHYLYLQQQRQGQVSPAAAGTSSVHHHHLSLQQGQEPALHLKDAEDDKHSAGPSS